MSRASMIVLAGQSLTMSSREIAELTGSTHDNVLKTIRGLAERGVVSGNETPYVHPQNGQTYNEFKLSYRDTMVVVSGYSVELRAKIIDRWQELEAHASQPLVPQTLPDALRLAADLAEKAQIAAAERDEAIRTKALIGSRREASAMGKASAAVREANKLRDRLGFNTRHATVTAVENVTKEKYEWLPLRKWCKAHGVTPETIPDKRYGEVKAWPADAWGEVYGVDLAEVFAVEACV